ncbi:hypothetical protein EJB05_48671, partial [Eragrostis curvula]
LVPGDAASDARCRSLLGDNRDEGHRRDQDTTPRAAGHMIFGPESVAFDGRGGGPYVSVSDGRILKYGDRDVGWTTFAYTPSYLKNNYSHFMTVEISCAADLWALWFHRDNGYLYITDSYMDLMRVGRNGSEATVLVTEAAGMPLCFTNGVDVDQVTGVRRGVLHIK